METLIDLSRRPRRLRNSQTIRNLVQETYLFPHQLVQPLFIMDGKKKKEAIPSLHDVFRYSIDMAAQEIETCLKLGVRVFAIFCYTKKEKKDLLGSEATKKDSLLQRAIRSFKKSFPDICLIADIALDPFTSHGHDGVVQDGRILNDATVHILGEMALRAAEAGVDIVAPSDMMDGRVGHIRSVLDRRGFIDVLIMSYAAKYASALYAPFRQALDSTLAFGDKKSYQLNPANAREALLECELDVAEGADMLLIKPALTNLDIIAKVAAQTSIPIGAYHVSGEYAMVHAAAHLLSPEQVFYEQLLSIRRAGASFIFTYAAKSTAAFIMRTCYAHS